MSDYLKEIWKVEDELKDAESDIYRIACTLYETFGDTPITQQLFEIAHNVAMAKTRLRGAVDDRLDKQYTESRDRLFGTLNAVVEASLKEKEQ